MSIQRSGKATTAASLWDQISSPFSSGKLEKLTITACKPDGTLLPGEPVKALFNPSQLKYKREVEWKVTAAKAYGGAADLHLNGFLNCAPETLSLDLFFDTYEERPDASGQPSSVVDEISKLATLAKVNTELHHPPLCRLEWGSWQVFTGFITSLSEHYSMFREDGTPVRATVSCSLREYDIPAHVARANELHSSDVHKTWVVRHGDTLSSIAAAEYGDPRAWRLIAKANAIGNPRLLRLGRVLKIPTRTPGTDR